MFFFIKNSVKMADENTKSLLATLGLRDLSSKFEEERVDLLVINSRDDQDLIRLGVATIGDRVRLRDACRRFLRNETVTVTNSSNDAPSRQSNIEERRLLFSPRSLSGVYFLLFNFVLFPLVARIGIIESD